MNVPGKKKVQNHHSSLGVRVNSEMPKPGWKHKVNPRKARGKGLKDKSIS